MARVTPCRSAKFQVRPSTTRSFGRGHDVVWVAGGGGLGSLTGTSIRCRTSSSTSATSPSTTVVSEQTTCDEPMPWPLAKFSADTISLIEQVCEPPVSLVAISFGSAIAQQVAIDRPDLVRSAIVDGDRFAKRVGGAGTSKRPRSICARRADASTACSRCATTPQCCTPRKCLEIVSCGPSSGPISRSGCPAMTTRSR